MNARTKRTLRWIVQGLILAALLFFIAYVFFGPTGQGAKDGGLRVLNKSGIIYAMTAPS